MDLNKLTTTVGAALVLVGVAFYAATSFASLTAMIPALVGLLILAAGLVARRPGLHKHGIHAALGVALLGALGSLMNVAKIGSLLDGTAERPAAIAESAIMFVVLVGYLIVGVRSFVRARVTRQA